MDGRRETRGASEPRSGRHSMPVIAMQSHFAVRTKGDYARMAQEIERVVDWLRRQPNCQTQRADELARIAAEIRRDAGLPASGDPPLLRLPRTSERIGAAPTPQRPSPAHSRT